MAQQVPPKKEMVEKRLVQAMKAAKLKSRFKYIYFDNCVIEIEPGEEDKVIDILSDAHRGLL